MVVVQNALNTVLIVGELFFQPKGESGDTRTVARQSAALATAIESGQLVLLEATPEPGDAFLLGEVIGTGVEQGVAHGLVRMDRQDETDTGRVPPPLRQDQLAR